MQNNLILINNYDRGMYNINVGGSANFICDPHRDRVSSHINIYIFFGERRDASCVRADHLPLSIQFIQWVNRRVIARSQFTMLREMKICERAHNTHIF